jgi:hypothetical protein
MDDITLQQAIYGNLGGYRFLARSPGFLEEWLPEAERLCTGFGNRPAGVACPSAVFAQPFAKTHVAVVHVADQGADDTGRPGALGFHLLLLTRADYARLGGDPFGLVERFEPSWFARGDLPGLTCPAGPLLPRTVAQVQQVLQRAGGAVLFAGAGAGGAPDEEEDAGPEVRRGGSQVLLGGCQVLVDGGRLVVERPAPDPELLRALWLLLPANTRCTSWPATFAFGNALHFHVLVVPQAAPEDYPHYTTEEQAADYPEGRYELALQTAAEAGDQHELDRLFHRRSRAQIARLVVVLLLLTLTLAAIIQLLPLQPAAPPAQQPAAGVAVGGKVAPDLPPPADYPKLSNAERQRLTQALADLAEHLQVEAPGTASAEQLVEAIDQRLGTPDPKRAAGKLAEQGPVQRQLRVLLWKHDLPEYREPALNPVELVERLQQKVRKDQHAR